MGYRSDVAYSIAFESEGDMKTFIATAMAMQKNAVTALAECHISTDHHEINFSAEDTKWYESFEDVQAHMALLGLVDDMTEEEDSINAAYLFLRVGEDKDDNETREGGEPDLIPYDNLELVRRVSTNMDTLPNYDEANISIANIFSDSEVAIVNKT